MLLMAGAPLYAEPVRPNVIMLFIDDLGYGDIGVFGCKDIPTPNIDRLANEGVIMTQSYVTNPPCCPSRASLMMGTYAQRFGKYGMMRGMPLPADKPTFAEVFLKHGYVTGQVGKWDVGDRYQKAWARGFMEVAVAPAKVEGGLLFLRKDKNGKDIWLTELDGDRLIEFVDRNRKKGKPFMMYWSPLAVHSPHDNIPEKYPARTTAPEGRRKLAGGIVCLDDQIGKLLDYLDTHKMRKNTLIIFASDNGPNIGEGGTSTPYEGGKGNKNRTKIGWTLTPSIVSWPGVIPKGTRFDGMMCTFDFYATMLAAAKLPIPEHIDGVDLMPYLTGKKKGNVREYIFWLNKGSPNLTRNLEAVRWGKWRSYRTLEKDPWRLYDLEKDPREENDLAKKFPEVLKRLNQKHAQWKSELSPIWKPQESGRTPRLANQELSEQGGWIITDGRVVYEKVDVTNKEEEKKVRRQAKEEKRRTKTK